MPFAPVTHKDTTAVLVHLGMASEQITSLPLDGKKISCLHFLGRPLKFTSQNIILKNAERNKGLSIS